MKINANVKVSVNMPHTTRFAQIKARYDVDRAARAVKSPVAPGEVVSLALKEPWLAQAVAAMEAEYGLHGFVSSAGRPAHPDYASLSLTCNPHMTGDPHLSTLGCPAVSTEGHYYGKASAAVRDSYYDTYGFHTPTPAAKKHLAPLFARMKRSPVRSRLSVIRGGHAAPASFCWGWHKDESVFENLRVNIHVTASPDHRIQIMREDSMPTGVKNSRLAEQFLFTIPISDKKSIGGGTDA